MDNLTHTLVAVTLARTPLGRAGRGTTAALVLASNAPDLDVLVSVGGAADYLRWHRGPTHGPLGLIGVALATAGVVWLARRWMRRGSAGEDASFVRLTLLGLIGAAGHVLMDLPTSYGTRMLSPFDWHWFGADWLPIIDIYLLAILIGGLAFGQMVTSRAGRTQDDPARTGFDARRRNASIALVLMMANYAVRGVAHQQAVAAAPAVFGPLLPRPCAGTRGGPRFLDRWPTDRQTTANDNVSPRGSAGANPAPPGSRRGARCLVEVAAMPTFMSPFHWRVIARMSNGYELADVNLFDRRSRGSQARGSGALWRMAVTHPDRWTPHVFTAAETRVGRVFLGFSRFPAARATIARDGSVTVRWTDLRFLRDLRRSGPGASRSSLFTATVRLGPDGAVVDERIGP